MAMREYVAAVIYLGLDDVAFGQKVGAAVAHLHPVSSVRVCHDPKLAPEHVRVELVYPWRHPVGIRAGSSRGHALGRAIMATVRTALRASLRQEIPAGPEGGQGT